MCSCQVLIQVGSNCIWLCHMDMIHDIMLYVTWRCITEIICMFHALRSNAGISLALFKWCLWNTTWSWWPLSTFTLWYRLSNLDRFARPQEFQGFFSPILNASQLSVHSFCCQVKVGDSNRISLLITFSLLVCIFQFKQYKMFGLVVIFFFLHDCKVCHILPSTVVEGRRVNLFDCIGICNRGLQLNCLEESTVRFVTSYHQQLSEEKRVKLFECIGLRNNGLQLDCQVEYTFVTSSHCQLSWRERVDFLECIDVCNSGPSVEPPGGAHPTLHVFLCHVPTASGSGTQHQRLSHSGHPTQSGGQHPTYPATHLHPQASHPVSAGWQSDTDSGCSRGWWGGERSATRAVCTAPSGYGVCCCIGFSWVLLLITVVVGSLHNPTLLNLMLNIWVHVECGGLGMLVWSAVFFWGEHELHVWKKWCLQFDMWWWWAWGTLTQSLVSFVLYPWFSLLRFFYFVRLMPVGQYLQEKLVVTVAQLWLIDPWCLAM